MNNNTSNLNSQNSEDFVDEPPSPKYHYHCDTPLEKRRISVSKKLSSSGIIDIDYCPKCDLYVYGNGNGSSIEAQDPDGVLKFIKSLKRRNLLTHL